MMRGTLSGASALGGAITASGGLGGALSADTGRRSVQAFATVADMQAAANLFAGMVAHTNGFHASGDGGAAYYAISASGTANGMDVLALRDGLYASLVVTEAYVTPEMFGAYGDNTHDDTAAFQRAIDSGKQVSVPNGRYHITDALTISSPTTIVGESDEDTVIACFGSTSAFIVSSDYVTMERLYIITPSYYTTTENSLVGIDVRGTSDSHLYGFKARSVRLAGFQTGIYLKYAWSALVSECNCGYGLYGIRVTGLSVNSTIEKCKLSTEYNSITQTNVSIGIYFEGGVASEGWVVSNNLAYGFVVGVRLEDVTHTIITNNIIDFCAEYGIELLGTNYFSGNHTISDNYIAMTSADDFTQTAITCTTNRSSTQTRGNTIIGNLVIKYGNTYASYGINLGEGNSKKSVIMGNHLYNFAQGIRTACYQVVVMGNDCEKCSTYGINCFINGTVTDPDLMPIVCNNVGTQYGNLNVKSQTIVGRNLMVRTAPFAGAKLGDVILNWDIAASGAVLGWVCTNPTTGKFKPIELGAEITAE